MGKLITLPRGPEYPQLSNSLTFTDADETARSKLTSHPVKKNFIPYLNCNQILSATIPRQRAGRFKG
ncbi:hypothetical protein TNCV_417981 [Trichonephila clavipes]|nr:hypothetical protein TNCV_417981 [Trichonephila clavipes]